MFYFRVTFSRAIKVTVKRRLFECHRLCSYSWRQRGSVVREQFRTTAWDAKHLLVKAFLALPT